MKLLIKKGKTSKIVHIFIQDSSSTTGAGLTGLTSGSSGLVCYRARTDDGNAGATQLVLSAGTRGTWSSGGFVEKDSTNMPGVYELGLDNAGLATGVDDVVYMLKGATNMAPLPLEIQLTDFDPQDSVRLGLTALPNAAANSVGGLPVLDANSLVDVDVKRWLATAVTAATAGIPDVNAKNINNVATTSVTTINANQGTTQPVNFTGTGASAFVQSDVQDIGGVALATHAAGMMPADVRDVVGVAVSTTTAQLGVNVVQYNAQTAQTDANNLPKVDIEDINGNATAAQNVSKANQAIGRGTCTTGGTTSSVPTSAWTPGGAGVASGQFIGRTIIFDATTSTASLQGQATNITANTASATPTFTVGTLTTAPSSGDTFGVY